MSNIANPEKAYVWLDGDGFRAVRGTEFPTDPLSDTPTSGTSPAVTWDGYGGIEAGFDITPQQDVKVHKVWNRRHAPYLVTKGPIEERIKFRATDYSKATVLTALTGGSIVETTSGSGIWRWEPGADEDFSIFFRVVDETGEAFFHSEAVTLVTPPPRTFGGENLDGFEFELMGLSPIYRYTSFNPLAP